MKVHNEKFLDELKQDLIDNHGVDKLLLDYIDALIDNKIYDWFTNSDILVRDEISELISNKLSRLRISDKDL